MRSLRHLMLLTTALVAFAAAPAFAGPDGPAVVGGAAQVLNPGTANVTVNQFTDKAIVNWRLFDIGANERVQFNQPNSQSIILNRVTGGLGPSQILGTLDANGRVFVINRDGILFGPNSQVNTAGFLATTHDIRNDDFMKGLFNFGTPGRPDASIVNLGTITATNGGFAALVAPGVRNSGTITATLGTVGLAASNGFSLDFYGDKLVTLNVGDNIAASVRDVATGLPLKSLVTNDGKIKANGGRVELTAAAARQVVDAVINTSGVVEANTIGMHNGMIVLGAATAASKPTLAPQQTVKISGTLKAKGRKVGTTGGTIIATAENIEVANATINASGDLGGGKVLIGGDWAGGRPTMFFPSNPSARLESFVVPTASTVSMDAASKIDASALSRGYGGKIVLWADHQLSFAGTILALGGKEFGNGGFVETSGHVVNLSGTVNAGNKGDWLLDPANIVVDGTLANTIMAALNAGTNYTLATGTSAAGGDGDISFGTQVTWNTSATFTVSAYNNIILNSLGTPANISNTGGAAGNLILRADSTGKGTGTILMPASTFSNRVDWSASTGKVSVYYNPTAFGTQDNFTTGNGRITLASPSQITQYMLVNDKAHLQNITTNLAGVYALGTNIDASGGAMNPIGNISPTQFTGILDGNGGLGTNYKISNLLISPTTAGLNGIGLFGVIGAGGIVRNLNIDVAAVIANPNATSQFIGILAGQNFGTISNITVTNAAIDATGSFNGIIAGGLVGQNQSGATIQNADATVHIAVGNATSGSTENNAGGLVGVNLGTIGNSTASGVMVGGDSTNLGGFVARNEASGTILSSVANGSVTIDPTATKQSLAGGFVGFNFGTIRDSTANGTVFGGNPNTGFSTIIGGFAGINSSNAQIVNSTANGFVFGSANIEAGGFVGANGGLIDTSHATGGVTTTGNLLTFGIAGGFVALNNGTISNSEATGFVRSAGTATGGFVGENLGGTITNSVARGTVTDTSPTSSINFSSIGGFVGDNSGTISNSQATGAVFGVYDAGGFAGNNDGTIRNSTATGNVTGIDNAFLGGFVNGNHGLILDSTASGKVTGGINSVIGGFAAGNFGEITRSKSTGAVIGTSESFLGGLVGINFSLIKDSTSTATVTGTGTHNFAGGLVGANFGFIDPSQASGTVTSGPNSVVGGFVGANLAVRLADGTEHVGTVSPDSSATGIATGGPGSVVNAQVGQSYPVTGLPDLPRGACDGSGGFCDGTLFNPHPQHVDVQQPVISPLITIVNQFIKEQDLTTPPEVVKTAATTNPPATGARPPGPPNQGVPSWFGPNARLPSGLPPFNETRFASNEIMLQLGNGTPEQVAAVARALGLEIIATENVGMLGRTVYRFRITSGRSVRELIPLLEANKFAVQAQPVYVFELTQTQNPAGNALPTQGDSAQYIVSKLRLPEVHLLATGKDVLVAVVDSAIDVNHPDLAGVIADKFDSAGGDEKPHPHGTGMAGAIASHKRLLGVAPNARLLAIQAFGVNSGGAQGTSLAIVKGLNWAVQKGARVINMSFAGPKDPILEQAIKAMRANGIILIAAAGNAGPKSPPLFPGADPNVIAVSATDSDDKVYDRANRGKYVSIAAPGVDILVPAPDGGYQLTTGTSVAAAHVSGVAALLLERSPNLKPDEVKRILTSTATKLKAKPEDVGAGLVDPYDALIKIGPKTARAQ